MTDLVGAWLERDVVACTGRDAATFLQGQLSQDVTSMATGDSRWSLLLQPQGKVDSFLRVSRLADDEFVLDVDAGHGAAMVTRLERFKIRVECRFEALDDWRCLAIRSVPGADGTSVDGALEALDTSSAAIVADPTWPGVGGFDLLGPAVTAPEGWVLDGAAIERSRILAGVPAAGSELDESTIPAEAGQWLIDQAVSFTKGCFVGQELVARVDSRGSNTPRKLRLVHLSGSGAAPGSAVLLDGEEVGVLTSVSEAESLASLRRSVEPGAAVTVDGRAGVVEALPAG